MPLVGGGGRRGAGDEGADAVVEAATAVEAGVVDVLRLEGLEAGMG